MAKESMNVSEWLRKVADGADEDFLREAVRMMAQGLMELEVSDMTGAAYGQRSPERTNYRNGYRDRTWDTQAGAVELKIPKLREGSYMPSLLEARRRIDKAMLAVIQEAYVKGVSTRKVDDIVKALGMTGISKSSVSRMCVELDEVITSFLSRPLLSPCPYLWLDATYHKVREGGHVISMATVIAIGVTETGEREILGCAVGPSEDGAFWTEFLRTLVRRGLKGVRLAISDAHEGLKGAIAKVLTGASWQRCRVHFMRNALSLVPKGAQDMVAAAIRTIFAQPEKTLAHKQLERVADGLGERFPRVSELLTAAAEDILAYAAFPREHWRKIYSTNPLERLNKEIKRRTQVVGIFPNRTSLLRLTGALLLEQHDEWAIARRYLSLESMRKLNEPEEYELPAELMVAVG